MGTLKGEGGHRWGAIGTTSNNSTNGSINNASNDTDTSDHASTRANRGMTIGIMIRVTPTVATVVGPSRSMPPPSPAKVKKGGALVGARGI